MANLLLVLHRSSEKYAHKRNVRMENIMNIEIDNDISLIPYYPNYKASLKWYLDKDVCKQVDNRDEVYDLDLLKKMYNYLNKNGDLYYIKYKGRLCGDVSLRNSGEIAIVICKEYQNKHIGRKVVSKILEHAKDKGLSECFAEIYSFNKQSEHMFEAIGFKKRNEDKYYYFF